MLKFAKPKKSEYPQIADMVNAADQIYHKIYTPKEFADQGCATETVENLMEGEKNRTYLCAYDESGAVVGYASYRLKNPQTVWLSMLHVDPKHQKKNIGGALLKELEITAKKLGALVLVLETDKKASWAVRFYEKNNYQILSDENLKEYPFDKVLDKKQVAGRYIFGKKL